MPNARQRNSDMNNANKVVFLVSCITGYVVYYHSSVAIGEVRDSTAIASALLVVGLIMMGIGFNRLMAAWYSRKMDKRVSEAEEQGRQIVYRKNGRVVEYIDVVGRNGSGVGEDEEE